MKTKKILSIALAVLMLIGTFAVGASAESEIKDTDVIIAGNVISGLEESYWLTVDGALTADGASASNYNIRIIPDVNDTLRITFKDVQLSEISAFDGSNYCALLTKYNIYLYLQGKNRIDVMPEEYAEAYGIYTSSNITIHGDGSLEMNIGNENTVGASGIAGDTVDITGSAKTTLNMGSVYSIKGFWIENSTSVSDNASVVINEKFLRNEELEAQEGYEEIGVKAVGYEVENEGLFLSDNAKITVNMINTNSVKNSNQGFDIEGDLELWDNSQITVNGTDGMGSCGIAMDNGDLTVSGTSSIDVKAGKAETGYSWGIYLYNGRVEKQHVKVSDSAKITAVADNANLESRGIVAYADLTAEDNAYISATSGSTDSSSSDACGVCFHYGIELSGKAKLIGKSGNSSDENYGITTEYITASDDAVIEGYAGIGGADSAGIYSRNITVSGNAELTGESKGSTKNESAGIFTDSISANGNAVINAEGGNGVVSYGIYAECNTFVIEDNATVNAKSGKGVDSFAILAYEIAAGGNSVVVAEASGDYLSIGIYTVNLTAKDNANVRSTGVDSDEYSVGILCAGKMNLADKSAVEATGNSFALYLLSEITTDYDEPYILVSTDTNPENAVVYNGTDLLVSYEDLDLEAFYESDFKYVFIASEEPADPEEPTDPDAPEEPEEPAPELNFFEQLIADIVSFFNSIVEFFSSLFSFSF